VAQTIDRDSNGRAVRGPQPNCPPAEEVLSEHLAVQLHSVAFEEHLRSGFQFLPGMHQRFPVLTFNFQLTTSNGQVRMRNRLIG